MLHRFWPALAGFTLMPFALAANDGAITMDPSSPAAPTPSFQYQSTLDSYQPAIEDDATPAKRWRTANEEVARIGGHAGYMKTQDEASHASPGHGEVPSQPPTPAVSNHGAHHGTHH